MAAYTCDKCGMSVNMTCGECGQDLVHDTLTVDDGREEMDQASVTLTVVAAPSVRWRTSLGDVVAEILFDEAPIAAAIFLQYVED